MSNIPGSKVYGIDGLPLLPHGGGGPPGTPPFQPSLVTMEQWGLATAGNLVRMVPMPFARTVEIGPGSAIDQVAVKPANGPEVLLSVGQRFPVGDWKGPWSIRPARAVDSYPPIGVVTDWVAGSNGGAFANDGSYWSLLAPGGATSGLAGSYNAPRIASPYLELLWHRDERAMLAPVNKTRAPMIYRGVMAGPNGIQALTSVMACMYTAGRKTVRIHVGSRFTRSINVAVLGANVIGYGVAAEASIFQMAPAPAAAVPDPTGIPAGITYDTIVANRATNRYIIDDPPEYTFLVGYVNGAGGANIGASVHIEAHD